MSAFTQAAWHGFPLPLRDLPRYGSSGNCWSLASSLHSLFCLLNLLVTTEARSTSPTWRDWFCFPGVTKSKPVHHCTDIHICGFPPAPTALQRLRVRHKLPTGRADCSRLEKPHVIQVQASITKQTWTSDTFTHRISALNIGSLMPLFSCQLLLSSSHFCPSFLFSKRNDPFRSFSPHGPSSLGHAYVPPHPLPPHPSAYHELFLLSLTKLLSHRSILGFL